MTMGFMPITLLSSSNTLSSQRLYPIQFKYATPPASQRTNLQLVPISGS